MSYKHRKAEMKLQRRIDAAARERDRQSRIVKKRPKPAFKPLQPRETKFVESEGMRKFRELPSHTTQQNALVQAAHPVNDTLDLAQMDLSQLEARVLAYMGTEEGAVYARERDARLTATHRNKQTAPLYPKGPYQLITSQELPKMFNKKDGGL